MEAAMVQVAMDSGRLPKAAETPNSLEKTGSKGCTSYSVTKVQKRVRKMPG